MRQTLGWGLLGCALVSCVLVACAAVGTLADDDAGMGGGAGEPEPLDCARSAAETAAGQCVGTVLSFCVTGELRTVDCAVVGAECGLEPATQVFACRQPLSGPQPEPQPFAPEPGGEPEPAPGPGPQPEPQPGGQPEPEPEAPVGMPCEGNPDGTECDGDTIIICRGGEPGGRTDCGANGLTCGPVPSGGMGCVAGGGGPGGGAEPEPQPDAPSPPGGDGICGGRDGGARCDGNTVVQCRGGREDSRFDCAANGQTCQIFDNTWAGCEGENQNPNVPNPEPEPPGEPCTAENFFGRCVGNVLEGCNLIDMEVFRVDCTWLGATCGQQDGLFGCW